MGKTNKKTVTVIAVVEAIISIIMLVVVTKIAPVCTGMLEVASGKQVHMKCHYTGVVLVFLGILLFICAIVLFVTKQKLACGIMSIVIAAFVFVTLHDSIGIGICANPDMACQMTAPLAKICATMEMVCGAISVFLTFKEQK